MELWYEDDNGDSFGYSPSQEDISEALEKIIRKELGVKSVQSAWVISLISELGSEDKLEEYYEEELTDYFEQEARADYCENVPDTLRSLGLSQDDFI